MNQYGPVALALGLIALSIGLWELSWFRRSGAPGRKTFPAFSTHQIWCIACSAALALANGVGAMMGHEGKDFYSDLCTVARCLWVYHYVQLLMAFFDPRGNGGRHELIVRKRSRRRSCPFRASLLPSGVFSDVKEPTRRGERSCSLRCSSLSCR